MCRYKEKGEILARNKRGHQKSCRNRKQSEVCWPYIYLKKTKNFHSFNKYVLSTNQVLAKATKMKRQCLPTRGIVKKETCLMGFPGGASDEESACQYR